MRKTAPFRSYRNQEEPEKGNRERIRILEAIEERSFQKASRLLKEHILQGKHR